MPNDRLARRGAGHKPRPRWTRILAPAIHKEVWEFYEPQGGLPHDDILKRYLVWERSEGSRFTDDSVGPFIERLRTTLDFAGIACEDKGGEKNGNANLPSVGDFVQWESQGAYQFNEPRRLTGISEDGEWAFVEGSPTGVPVSELTVANPLNPANRITPQSPPVNPNFTPPPPPARQSKPVTVLVAYAEDGTPIYATVTFDAPQRRGLLKRLAKQLESLEELASEDAD